MSDGKKPSHRDLTPVTSARLAASERASSLGFLTPLMPGAPGASRTHAAWRTWLAALAKDAAAATAAALAYESLPGDGRDAWLDALDADAPDVDVPKIALYAPLLGVEQDEGRRTRIAANVTGAAKKSTPPQAFTGLKRDERVCVIVSPLYLDFVEVLVCTYDEELGVNEARHEWLVHKSEIATLALAVGVSLTEVPLPDVVEELAHAVLAGRRAGRAAPPALLRSIDLFATDRPLDSDIEPCHE